MKKILAAALLAGILSSGVLSAATRGDVRVLEASDSIRLASSRLAKEYLLYLQFPHKHRLQALLKKDLATLESGMHDIAISTKDPKTKGVLKFFAYEKVQIESLLQQPPTIKGATEILDFSESFFEGSTAIARRHQYVPAPEEEMWLLTRTMDQILEETTKYYLAAHVIKDDPELKNKMQEASARFSRALSRINAYPYDADLKHVRRKINTLWDTLAVYLEKSSTLPLPLIATLMSEQMETSIDTLGVYHSTNQ